MKVRELPSQNYLKECFTYDPETGLLCWKERPLSHFKNEHGWKSCNGRNSGREAFTAESHGYRNGSIDHQVFHAQRVIWKLVYGEDPEFIDHINGKTTDNRLANLRSISHKENMKNQKKDKRNKSGTAGVYWQEDRKKWLSVISIDGKVKNLGRFKNLEDAIDVRKKAEVEYGYHTNHGRE